MSRISRGTPAGDAYLDLKTQARRSGRPTDELIQLYLLECFLARLVISSMRDKLVLKGGVLLATLVGVATMISQPSGATSPRR
jgi:hypothetical protein